MALWPALLGLAIASQAGPAGLASVSFQVQGRQAHPQRPELRFRVAQAPPSWWGHCAIAPKAEALYRDTHNTIEYLRVRATLWCEVAGEGQPRRLAQREEEVASRGPLAQGRFDGQHPEVARALRALPPGRHRLRLDCAFLWDEHVDGGTYEGREALVGQGHLPLRILP